MKKIELWFWALATSSKGNPFSAVITIMCFYVMFHIVEAQLEKLIFAKYFMHWLDPILTLIFIIAAGYSVLVLVCARYNVYESQDKI